MQNINKDYMCQESIGVSVAILENHLEEVCDVTAWAELMGYTRSHFTYCFTEHFGESPSDCLSRIRYRQLHKIILRNSDVPRLIAAARLGLKDEHALETFLDQDYNTCFTEVRNKLLDNRLVRSDSNYRNIVNGHRLSA